MKNVISATFLEETQINECRVHVRPVVAERKPVIVDNGRRVIKMKNIAVHPHLQ